MHIFLLNHFSLVLGSESHVEEKPMVTKKPEKSGLAGRYA
jgi:hypothetical protein